VGSTERLMATNCIFPGLAQRSRFMIPSSFCRLSITELLLASACPSGYPRSLSLAVEYCVYARHMQLLPFVAKFSGHRLRWQGFLVFLFVYSIFFSDGTVVDRSEVPLWT
jgi:hypothetical protein